MERRIFILMAILLSFAITCSLGTMANADSSALLKSLRKFDRSVCHSIPATCRARVKKRAKRQHSVRRSKPAAEIEKVASPIVQAEPKIAATAAPTAKTGEIKPPIPRAKPIAKPEEKPAKPEKQVAIALPAPVVLPKIAAPEKAKPDNSDDGCLQQLRAIGAEFTIAGDNVDSGLCHVYNPVHLNSVRAQKDVVKLPEAPLLNCKFALQFSKWVRESGAPILSAQMNSPLDKLATGPGFECRGRNGDASAKISEHGYGNAVDITTFRMRDGEVVSVADAQNTAAASYSILRGLRASACGYFTTVLGPGSNEAHKTHFHFDLGAHGKTGNYRICE
jgi:hypothetical protein